MKALCKHDLKYNYFRNGSKLKFYKYAARLEVYVNLSRYVLDVLWGQPIKLIQVASNSELRENQWNDLLFFEIVPAHCFGASEVVYFSTSKESAETMMIWQHCKHEAQ